jgi:hypothetical protein
VLLPLDTVAVMLAIAGVTGWWFLRSSARPGWTDRHRYAAAAGIVFFLPVVSPLMELIGQRGQIVVGIVFAWLLRRTWRRLRAAEAVQLAPESGAGVATTHAELAGDAAVG